MNLDHTRTLDGASALHMGVQNGDIEVCKILLQAGASANKTSKDGFPPLYIALVNGHTEIYDLLLKFGADINHATEDGYTYRLSSPMHIAAANGRLDFVKTLLASSAAVDKRRYSDGATPLITAIENGHLDIVHYLVTIDSPVGIINGAMDQYRFTDGFYPIHVACSHGHLKILDTLIEVGADLSQLDKLGGTPLHAAASFGQAEIVSRLVDLGCDLKAARTSDDASPLVLAVIQDYVEVVKVLLAKGAGKAKARDLLSLILLLIHTDPHSDPNQSCKDGTTPLLVSALHGKLESFKRLLSAGADPALLAADGESTIYSASIGGHADLVKFLLATGGDPNQSRISNGWSPLHVSAREGKLDVVKALLANGAEVDRATLDDGSTALHLAAENGHVEVVTRLIVAGASISLARSSDKKTPLHCACKKGRVDVIAVLLYPMSSINVQSGGVTEFASNQQVLANRKKKKGARTKGQQRFLNALGLPASAFEGPDLEDDDQEGDKPDEPPLG